MSSMLAACLAADVYALANRKTDSPSSTQSDGLPLPSNQLLCPPHLVEAAQSKEARPDNPLVFVLLRSYIL